MTHRWTVHPDNPQQRLLAQAGASIRNGGVVAYPTDSGYAIGCCLDNKEALDRIRAIRQLPETHHFTLVCKDLSHLSQYAQIDNTVFRMVKALTPGAFTIILPATKDVPKRLWHPKRSDIGLRVPDYKVVQALLTEINGPLLSVSLILPGDEFPLTDADSVLEAIGSRIDGVIDAGWVGHEPTTVVDLTSGSPEVVRQGAGKLPW
jgi:tRNA threonylcarbamoyl adenosine modification protein (Sua5/YciO/YrdC/YwlC family)